MVAVLNKIHTYNTYRAYRLRMLCIVAKLGKYVGEMNIIANPKKEFYQQPALTGGTKEAYARQMLLGLIWPAHNR